ncbi:MAG: hypothetical protein H6814_00165 [Phycisphaeraceae bacterium]|nr:hypothetical protein [Phycisphaeraceae bacterium]
MSNYEQDDLAREAAKRFREMVESVGVKGFSSDMTLSTRQINRMLSGAQPNPVERLIRCLQCCDPDVGDAALSFICQEAGGHFVKDTGVIDHAIVNAVRECAEAIAAISDGEVSPLDRNEVHEAIAALKGVLLAAAAGEQAPEVHVRPTRPASRDGQVNRSA